MPFPQIPCSCFGCLEWQKRGVSYLDCGFLSTGRQWAWMSLEISFIYRRRHDNGSYQTATWTCYLMLNLKQLGSLGQAGQPKSWREATFRENNEIWYPFYTVKYMKSIKNNIFPFFINLKIYQSLKHLV